MSATDRLRTPRVCRPRRSPPRVGAAVLGVLVVAGAVGCKGRDPPPPLRASSRASPPGPAPTTSTALTAYRFARVIPEPGTIIEGGVIVVDGGKFREVLAADAAVPAGAAVIDLSRYTAIPGLIDAHTHLSFCWLPEWRERPPGERVPRDQALPLAEVNARRVFEVGVTTVRDLGALHRIDLALAERIDAGSIIGPRIIAATDGIWPSALDAQAAEDDSPGPADGPEAVAAAATARLQAGAQVIKIYASTGSADDLSGRPLYGYAEIKAAVDVAHAAGVRVAVHDYLGLAADDIVRAGADTIEHARDLSDATLAAMRERGVAYVPTIAHNLYYLDNIDTLGLDAAAGPRFEAYVAANIATARRAHAAGVNVVMGSDSVFTGFGANTRELDVFVERVGMTPMEALATATTGAARALGIDDRLGAIRPGYEADFVVIDGDLSRIEHVHAVVMVVKGGAALRVDRSGGDRG